MGNYYFESENETTFGDEQRVEPGDERSAAITTARSWELPYLDDEPLLIDSESAARVGGEELRASALLRSAAATATSASSSPTRRPSASPAFASTSPAPWTSASSRPRRSLPCSTPRRWRAVSSVTDQVTNGLPLRRPVWGRSLERVLTAFDTEATRLQDLRGKLQELGGEMAAREQRVQELETELQRMRVERLRDQEAVDRLKHELSDRNNRLERALSKTHELAAIIQGGHLS